MNTRAVLRCLKDGKRIHAWVIESRLPGLMEIRLNEEESLVIGAEYELSLTSPTGSANTRCRLLALREDRLVLSLPHQVRVKQTNDNPRVATPAHEIELRFGGKSTVGTMVDISMTGLGVETTVRVPCGELIQLEIKCTSGVRIVSAKAVYCKKLPEEKNRFRVGFAVGEDRVSKAVWNSICVKVLDMATRDFEQSREEAVSKIRKELRSA